MSYPQSYPQAAIEVIHRSWYGTAETEFRKQCLIRVLSNPYWRKLAWNSPKRLNREIADLEARTKTDRD